MLREPGRVAVGDDACAHRLGEVARLRVLVGYLGEKAQQGWWPSEFYSAASGAFLTPVFGRTASLARYHGVIEAARRVHDEHIGVGRVFYLFRLPETEERALFELLQKPEAAAVTERDIDSQSAALSALQSLSGGASAVQEGPTQIGNLADLEGSDWLCAVARCYYAAFAAGSRAYPYFVARA